MADVTSLTPLELDWVEGVDLFGVSGVEQSRRRELENMLSEQQWSLLRDKNAGQLRNDSVGRKVSSDLADLVFNMLLTNGFEQIKVNLAVETDTACVSEKNDSQMWFSWDDFAGSNHYLDTDHGSESYWDEYMTANPEAVNYDWSNYFLSLDLSDDKQYDFAKKYAKALSDRTNAIIACQTCPLMAQCIASSITMPSSNGGFTDGDASVDPFGIYGGLDYESRAFVHRKLVAKIRVYNRELRKQQIISVEANSEGLSDTQWDRVLKGEEVVAEEEINEELSIDDLDRLANEYAGENESIFDMDDADIISLNKMSA